MPVTFDVVKKSFSMDRYFFFAYIKLIIAVHHNKFNVHKYLKICTNKFNIMLNYSFLSMILVLKNVILENVIFLG